jgi:hypothetical protein
MTRPTAAPARFPYTEHRTMAEVMAEETLDDAMRRGRDRERYDRERRSLRTAAAP